MAWVEGLSDAESLARHAALAALATRTAPGAVVILLTDDDSVQDLNNRFRGKDAPTNVLAFPSPAGPRGYLGDIAVAFGVCDREARDQAKPLADHLSHLVIHGVLHLMGYDHEDDAQAEVMESIERKLLAGMGVPDPYRPGPDLGVARDALHHG